MGNLNFAACGRASQELKIFDGRYRAKNFS